MINFNVPPYVGDEDKFVLDAIHSHKISGDGKYTKKCNSWMEEHFNAPKVMLTTSGSTALDMAIELCGIEPGDEVIIPSYLFSRTGNFYVFCGARLGFVGIVPDADNTE